MHFPLRESKNINNETADVERNRIRFLFAEHCAYARNDIVDPLTLLRDGREGLLRLSQIRLGPV